MNGNPADTAGVESADTRGANDHPKRSWREYALDQLAQAEEALRYSNRQEAQEARDRIIAAIAALEEGKRGR